MVLQLIKLLPALLKALLNVRKKVVPWLELLIVLSDQQQQYWIVAKSNRKAL
jgi:Na+-transporting NADH:ubiquinone oxidoreductase subunit NqrB